MPPRRAIFQWIRLLRSITMALALTLGACVAAVAAQTAPKPHIIFFMADDTGWWNVGWHDTVNVKTPNAVELVKEGIELDRHYAFVYCSPSRTSFMTGRLPYHAQQKNFQNCFLGQGAPDNMTFVSEKLKSAGYATAMFGKWHLGTYSQRKTPQGRGFDTSLLYFEGAEDHMTQRSCQDPECMVPINASSGSPYDLWSDSGPATGLAGKVYNGFLFNDHAVDFIEKHDPSQPMFMYMATANSHTPLEAPQEYLDMYPIDWYIDRRQYAAMCSFWDSVLGNITTAVKSKGMWETTLLVFSSDNGGPTYWSVTPSFQHGAGANNWPLKGSKVSAWEGGIRVAAFASGGMIPESVRGTKLTNFIHMADWYATFCGLAGVDPADTVAAAHGLPPIDSKDLWPLLTGKATGSPRRVTPAVVEFNGRNGKLGNVSALLIDDRWKFLVGVQVLSYWQGPDFPNASSVPYGKLTDPKLFHLCAPCLFDVVADPGEHNDVAKDPANREVVRAAEAFLLVARRSVYQPAPDPDITNCQAAVKKYGNFYGPWRP